MPITTAAGVPIGYGVYGTTVTSDPDPKTCNYTHFDLSTEQLGRTWRYNCWGFTFLPRRYWIDSDTDVDNIIRDNCVAVPTGSIQPGDVIRYRDDSGVTTHTGRVWETDGSGNATLVRSKWGSMAEYLHVPLDVPSIYGTHLAYFRQALPLLGVADLWIKDSPADDGGQCSDAPWWVSPDIMIDVPPYDSVADLNPVFNHINRVWTRVHNRSNLDATDVYVRYYWADPSVGLPPSNWHLIPGTPGHPNPAGPITIAANSTIDIPYVEWTPSASPAHQCLLAVAYINDNPRDSNNPDPLVYPFDVPWDNCIAQRNIHIIEANSGFKSKFSVVAVFPFHTTREIKGSLNVVLTYANRLPVLGPAKQVTSLDVSLVLDRQKKLDLVPWTGSRQLGRFKSTERRLLGVAVAGGTFDKLLFTPKKRHKIDVEVTVPKKVNPGSIYYLHIVQQISNTVMGGYTAIIMVR